MGLKEIVDQRPDLIEREFRRSVGIQHRGMISVLPIARQRRLHGEGLDIDVRADEAGQLGRKGPDVDGVETRAIHHHRHLDAAVGVEIGDQPGVLDVAINHSRGVGHFAVDDQRSILARSLDFQGFAAEQLFPLVVPAGDLVFAPPDIFVQWDVELVDQIGAISADEVGAIFAEVLARFGDEIPEAEQHLVPNSVPIGGLAAGRDLPEPWVEILALVLKLQIESDMVDPGAEIVDLLGRDAQITAQLVGGSLDAMAKPHVADRGGRVHRPTQHGHRVGVVEHQGVGAIDLHVGADIKEHRNGPESPEDPPDPEGVGDRLAQPVFLRDFKVDHGARLVTGDLDHVDHVIGFVEGLNSVCGRRDLGLHAESVGHPAGDEFTILQSPLIDIHQGQMSVSKFGKAEDIPDQVLGKNSAPRTDEGDLDGHGSSLSPIGWS